MIFRFLIEVSNHLFWARGILGKNQIRRILQSIWLFRVCGDDMDQFLLLLRNNLS